MGPIEVGSAVTPVNGRYEGLPMVVVSTDGNYAEIVDGKRRRLARPKRKKLCHLRSISSDGAVLPVNAELTDGTVRRYLASYRTVIPDKKHDSN